MKFPLDYSSQLGRVNVTSWPVGWGRRCLAASSALPRWLLGEQSPLRVDFGGPEVQKLQQACIQGERKILRLIRRRTPPPPLPCPGHIRDSTNAMGESASRA
ncbi:hypothetical protein K239x_17370 [Planctomycetes bacterium K23_9]|uniref:Uncharacterized protein n=1 Tax=Stieleria marina TaxID=1930275 RepID=A0A517NRS7_9BACT|nr:hypothetical protein K239x_17370 [Planctomycetes bacterium K23_9]